MPFRRQRLCWTILALARIWAPCSAQAQARPSNASMATPCDSAPCRTTVDLASREGRVPGLKSGNQALLWSLLGTTVPIAAALIVNDPENPEDPAVALLILGGVFVGPSLGHFYSGRPGRALVGMGFRAVALAGVVGGFAAAWNNNEGGDALMLAGLALGATVIAWDILRAPHSANVHNKRLNAGRIAIAVVPLHDAVGARLSARITF